MKRSKHLGKQVFSLCVFNLALMMISCGTTDHNKLQSDRSKDWMDLARNDSAVVAQAEGAKLIKVGGHTPSMTVPQGPVPLYSETIKGGFYLFVKLVPGLYAMEIGYEGYDLLPGPMESRGRLSEFRSVSNYTTFLRLEAGHVYVVQAKKYKASLDSQGQQRYEWGFWVVDKNTGTRIDPISELNKSRKDIPTLNADVGSLVFFESDQASGSRTYGLRFPRSEVRYIYWQLFLQHPSPEGRLDFDLEAVWIRRSDGSVLHRWVEPCTIQKGWTWSTFGKGYGSKEAGSFNIGIYLVELYIKGNKIASSTFEIY